MAEPVDRNSEDDDSVLTTLSSFGGGKEQEMHYEGKYFKGLNWHVYEC